MLREFPRSPVDCDYCDKQANEILERTSGSAGVFDCGDLSESVACNGIAFACEHLIALQRNNHWWDLICFTFLRCRSRRLIQHNVGPDEWNERKRKRSFLVSCPASQV